MIGYIGATLLLIGYMGFSFRKIPLRWYHLSNFVSCGLLAVNAYHLGSIPFVVVNIVFSSVGIISFLKMRKRRGNK